MVLSDFTKGPKSFKFDCTRAREHSSEKSCSIFEAFERVKGFERLQRDYMQCSKLNDKRLDGIEKRMLKLKRIIINSVCQAHAMSTSNLYSESAISIEDCKQWSLSSVAANDTDYFYDQVIEYLTV